jgi:hypothetical protein
MECARMSSTWQSILSGGVVAIFAFGLAMTWDMVRFRRERRSRDLAIFTFTIAEIDALIGIAANNHKLVEHELLLLSKQNQSLLNPLDLIDSAFWNIIVTHTPHGLLTDPTALSKVRRVARLTDQVGQMIRSREGFRAANQALSSFNEQMTGYDKLLQKFLPELVKSLKELRGTLESAQKRY